MMHVFNVIERFDIPARGVVAVVDTTHETMPSDLALKIGDPIELRQSGRTVLCSHVAGIEHCDPWSPKRLFAFLLPPTVTKQDVPVGAEVWVSSQSIRSVQ